MAKSQFLSLSIVAGCICAPSIGWARGLTLDSMQGRWLAAAVISLAYFVFCVATVRKYQRTQREQEALWTSGENDTMVNASSATETKSDTVLIAFASQTGFSEQLAVKTAQSMRDSGLSVRILPLGRVDENHLASVSKALFIVSTTGEGDAPDGAAGFARRMAETDIHKALDLRFGILALGDLSYAHYCAFGHALESWLHRRHAQPLFDTVEVDNGDEGALRHWQHHLGVLSGHTEVADWSKPAYGRWRLAERRLLNAGSIGGPAFHLALTPIDLPAPSWQAGDIAEIGPRNSSDDVKRFLSILSLDNVDVATSDSDSMKLLDALASLLLPHEDEEIAALSGLTPVQLSSRLKPLPHREYSIASLPDNGTLDLLVRRILREDDRLGIGSGWLTQHVAIGGEIALRVRSNRNFHPPTDNVPLILIGNGTGLAGLRAHVQARAAAGRYQNWLIFGERSRDADYLHWEEIEAWLASGLLKRVDLAFSRDQIERIYVQDKLREAADELRRWVDDGAAIYVCGSLLGMASGVADALEEVLGESQMMALAEAGRYRRDVY
ncbi:sulfite reductase flavoprotein subunit alpha [Glaciimonas sp. PCH181]|uniref:sulfite reductase subunit alpha n=1 Tax=Glaciimonas sp. PCH181 TaxID=2133943 RepID=UPI000D351F0F|nr:sulfite reductase flavoprotein subunit alpha [Glaciimonas sp. PCH181]PUA19837.1 sulfite reductase subunit alpha [Glaciimonas sp. PCH181]